MSGAALKPFGEGLFYAEGDVPFFGVPIQTRMFVVRLRADKLWVCSPLPLNDEIARELDELGRVAEIVSPNKLHNLGLASFHRRYPEGRIWASPGLAERCPDLHYAGALGNQPHDAWAAELDQRVTAGNVFFSEAVFFHRRSRTLLVADLVENITDATMPTRTGRALTRLMRIHGRPLPSPEFRIYTNDPDAARKRLAEINEWPFERILPAHGVPITEDAHAVFAEIIDALCSEVSRRPLSRRRFYSKLAKWQ